MAEKVKNAASKSRIKPIELLYRPVFDIHLNMAIDYETTMRINDKTMGVMLPELFVPIARKSNQITRLDLWTVEEICEAVKRCTAREADVNSVIMDISVKSLAKKSIVNQIKKIIDKYDIKPDVFCFNIKESIFEDVKEQVKANIDALREMGFKISIDDFGLEYTALSHLTHYDVDYIGIHSSLLDDFMVSEKVQNTIQGLVDFCRKIDTQIRIDGVESKEMFDMLKKMGVDQFTGSYFGDYMKENKIS